MTDRAVPVPLMEACQADPRLFAAVFEQPGSGLAYFPREPSSPVWISARLLCALGAAPDCPGACRFTPHPEDQEKVRALLDHGATGSSNPEHLTLRWQEGSEPQGGQVRVLTQGHPLIIFSQGETVGCLYISEAARALDAPLPWAFSPEFHFRSLVESLPLLLWTCDVEGQCDYLSPQWIEYTGVPAEAQLGIGWIEQIHPEDRSLLQEKWRAATTAKAPFETEYRLRGRRGSYAWFRARALPLLDSEGTIIRWLGETSEFQAEHDKSEQTLQALLAQQTLLDDFIAHTPAAIAMFDTEMRYLKTSEQWLRDYKIQDANIIGKTHYEVFPEIPERWRQIHKRALAGSIERAEEDAFLRADGTVEWLEWEIRPWRRADGSIGGIVFFTQVITSRKNLDLALEQQRQSLARSNRNLAEFLYAASHDLQEPLRAISGCAQLLSTREAERLDEESRTLLSHLVDGSVRMRSLIADLLAYSRIGTREASHSTVELDDVVQEAVLSLDAIRKGAGATLSIAPLPAILGDRAALVLFFQNLLDNALKYRNSGIDLHISISAETRPDELSIHVKDNGIGIPPPYHTRIFQLFQRLHTREEYPGNGIGLTICSRIAEQHGGVIIVNSEPGCGSDFALVLPNSRSPS